MSVHVRGHPIHVILVVFPIGLYVFSVIFDIVYAAGSGPGWYTAAYYNLLFGVVTTIPTALFGAFDYTLIRDPRAKSTAARHGGVMMATFGLFLLSLFLRTVAATEAGAPIAGTPWIASFALSIAGMALLAYGAWLGGELVYRHRVGVGIEPPDHFERNPKTDEAGNRASGFKDFPSPETV